MVIDLSTPAILDRPTIDIKFRFINGDGTEVKKIDRNWGTIFTKFDFKAMMNGGYTVEAIFADAHFANMDDLIVDGYFSVSRKSILEMKFKIKGNAESNEIQTDTQIAYVTNIEAIGESENSASIKLTAIDPPSWFLNVGNASGKAYKGRVSQIIKNVTKEYAPLIKLDISETKDSSDTYWYMMRQDPKTFIMSILEWGSSVTQSKTNWMIQSNGLNLSIKEQGKLPSKPRAYLTRQANKASTILNWSYVADNTINILTSKLITQGISRVSGQYLDSITDQKHNKVVVDDDTTGNKLTADTTNKQSFSKSGINKYPTVGYTNISSIPEIYSAGDLGIRYDEYIDGRARSLWLGLANRAMRVKFECVGHHIWNSCEGLGSDTVFVKWTRPSGTVDGGSNLWFMTGNWLVYGFHHVVTRGLWTTNLYCTRYDYDANSTKVGYRSSNSD